MNQIRLIVDQDGISDGQVAVLPEEKVKMVRHQTIGDG
jgi:hypothetical protein